MTDTNVVDKLRERSRTIQINAVRSSGAITAAFASFQLEAERGLKGITTANVSRAGKLRELLTLTSQVRAIAQPFAPCKRGCSDCCYQRVIVTQLEAQVIGEAIRRPPARVQASAELPPLNAFGRDTPCTFLADGECSIYEHRPFACRSYLNLDIDALVCSMENMDLAKSGSRDTVGIPLLGPGPLGKVYEELNRNEARGDIRQFFAR